MLDRIIVLEYIHLWTGLYLRSTKDGGFLKIIEHMNPASNRSLGIIHGTVSLPNSFTSIIYPN